MSVRKKLLAVLGLGVFALFGNLAGTANAQTTVTFQQGVDGYNGLFDLFIGRNATNGLDSGNANVAGSSVTDFFLDGRYNTSDDTQGLFRYDNIFGTGAGQIATGSRIVSATFELTTTTVEFADSGGPFGVGQLLTSFDSATTYNGVGEGFRYFQGESGRWQSNGFSGTAIDPGLSVTADVSKIVQNWANGDTNNGFAVTAGTTNGWSVFTSGNSADVTVTPKLTVTFDTPGPATNQSVYTQSANDTSNSMFLVSNDLGSFANADTTPLVNGNGTFPEVNFLTPSNGNDIANGLGQEAMIRYDNLFASEGGLIPDDAIIDSAFLLVNTPTYHIDDNGARTGASQNYDSPSTYSVRQVLNDWDGSGSPASLTFGSPVDGQFGMIADSESEFDVTSILQNWQNGDGNFGFNLYGSDGTNGWGILNSQAGGDAPQLVVNWRLAAIPEPGSFFVLTGLGVLALARRRR